MTAEAFAQDAPDPAPSPVFNELIHAPVRLRICSLLRRADRIEFGVLRDTLAVSDATLSKHLKVLADAGFVAVSKQRSADRSDNRRLTWVGATRAGAQALEQHLAALHRIAYGEPPTDAQRAPSGR